MAKKPLPRYGEVKVDPKGGTIKVGLEFPDTELLCTYLLNVREKDSNLPISGFPREGDNTNKQDDEYPLPMPAESNIGRRIFANLTIMDQTGDGGDYQVDMVITQDEKEKGRLSTTKTKMEGNVVPELLVAKLI